MNRMGLMVLVAMLAGPAGLGAQPRNPSSDSPTGAAARRGRRGTTQRPGQRTGGSAQQTGSDATTPDREPPDVPAVDADTLVQGIQAAAATSSVEGARSVSQLILRGVPPRAAAAGLDALAVMGRAEGSPAVERFLEHRRPLLRRHAIAAAQGIHTPALVRALTGKLSDSDEDVRVEAATALAEVGNHDAIEALLLAFERDLEATTGPEGGRLTREAARAIARIGTSDDLTRLFAFLRRAPFHAMADSMRTVLDRRDLPEPFKLRVISTLADLATREVREFLNSVVTNAHGQETPLVRAARTAASRIAAE